MFTSILSQRVKPAVGQRPVPQTCATGRAFLRPRTQHPWRRLAQAAAASATRFVATPAPLTHPIEVAQAPQPGLSYVSFHASRAEYERVLARLAATSSLPPLEPSSMATMPTGPSSTAPQQAGAGAGSWSGLLAGLLGNFGGSNNGSSRPQSRVDGPGAAFSVDDGSPLSRAVVMFTATWCGPCAMVHKELQQAVLRLDGRPACAVIVVDVEANKELASELGVKALPTLLYLGRDGTRAPIYTQGPVSASAILDVMDRAAALGGRDLTARWLKL